MTLLLLLGLLAVFGGIYLFFAVSWLVLRIIFGLIGGLFGLVFAAFGLLALGLLGLAMLPLLGLLALPLALPLLIVSGVIWLLLRNTSRRPAPAAIRH